MTALEDRRIIVRYIDEAHAAGARLALACQVVGITARTLQHWRTEDSQVLPDARSTSSRPRLAHALTGEEKALMLVTANEPRFASLPPARIVPMLADEGVYMACESSFQRVLRATGQNRRRGRARTPARQRPPTTHVATAPGQVWCWDMTYLPSKVRGQWFYLYLIMDLYSRKIVGWEIHEQDNADHAARLLNRVALSERIHANPDKPVLHGDDGSTLKATTVLAMLNWLGIRPSCSRPRVSDDSVPRRRKEGTNPLSSHAV
jgi:transposase